MEYDADEAANIACAYCGICGWERGSDECECEASNREESNAEDS